MTLAAPFPHPMHVELLRYGIDGCGGDPDRDSSFQTVPPPLMVEALAAGQVNAFRVGGPWASVAEERRAASLMLPTAAFWAYAPDKLARLIRALHRASRWVAMRQNHASAAELLARSGYLAAPPLVIERGLSGTLAIGPRGETRATPRFTEFGGPEATFPWRSQALWIAARAARRWGVEPAAARAAAASCFRPDLHRAALAPMGVDLSGASPDARRLDATLAALGEDIARAGLRNPAIILVSASDAMAPALRCAAE